jgi:hypothetical protein
MINREIPENYPFFLIPRTTFLVGDLEIISKAMNEIITQYFT